MIFALVCEGEIQPDPIPSLKQTEENGKMLVERNGGKQHEQRLVEVVDDSHRLGKLPFSIENRPASHHPADQETRAVPCRLNVAQLVQVIFPSGKINHNIGNKRPLLPFTTNSVQRVSMKDGFQSVAREFARILFGTPIEVETTYSGMVNRNVSVSQRLSDCYHDSELSSSGDPETSERKIARFLADVLVDDFQRISSPLVIFRLVNVTHLHTMPTEKKRTAEYLPKFKGLARLFTDDLLFLSEHREYFARYYPVLLNHYYFTYVSQLTLKLSLFHKADFSHLEKVYYILDWEPSSPQRPAHIRGFQWLMGHAKKLFVHVNCLAQLSHNTFSGDEIHTYSEIHQILMGRSVKEQTDYLHSVNQWIGEYCRNAGIRSPLPAKTLEDAYQTLFHCLDTRIPSGAKNRYALWIEEAAKPFLGDRSFLGKTLSVTQEFLLMMAAICVKSKRMPLQRLFNEFESRGLFFDELSKAAIVKLFEQKKLVVDGDVKPIW